MNKKIIVFVLTIILTIAGSFYLKSKTVSTTFEEQYQKFKTVQFNDAYCNFGPSRVNDFDIYHDVQNIDELVRKSQIIARIHFVERQQKYSTFYSKVKLVQLFKGKLSSEDIVIYEPMSIRSDILSIEVVHKPMDDSCDYIVFLQQAIPDDNQHFNLVNSALGMIPMKSQFNVKRLKTKLYDEQVKIARTEFEKYDFFDIQYHFSKDEVTVNMDGYSVIDDIEVYEKTKQLLFDCYSQILKEYGDMEGKIVFEDS